MEQKLFTVEDSFLVSGRGLIVVPGPLEAEFPGPAEIPVRLKRPDGSTVFAVLSVQHFFQTPPPKEYRWGCLFKNLPKAEVPIGTEVWYEPMG